MIIYVASLKKKITFLQSKSFRNLCVSDTNDPYHDVCHYVVVAQDSNCNTKSCFCNKQYVTTNFAI